MTKTGWQEKSMAHDTLIYPKFSVAPEPSETGILRARNAEFFWDLKNEWTCGDTWWRLSQTCLLRFRWQSEERHLSLEGFSGFGHRDLLASVLFSSSILVDSVSMCLTEGWHFMYLTTYRAWGCMDVCVYKCVKFWNSVCLCLGVVQLLAKPWRRESDALELELHNRKLWLPTVLVSFSSVWHKLESFGKRDSKLRKSLHNIDLKATLWSIFGWLMVDMGGPNSLWAVPFLSWWSWCLEKSGWVNSGEKTRKQNFSVASTSVSASKPITSSKICARTCPGHSYSLITDPR